MPRPGWYIVQVETGRERLICRMIDHIFNGVMVAGERVYDTNPFSATATTGPAPDDAQPLIEECFSPTFIHRLKLKGEWVDVEKRLLPGYIIVVTTNPAAVATRLRAVPKFTRLLVQFQEFLPMRADERAWLEEATRPKDRVIPISIAYRKGDTLAITQGPLKGREAMITRVIRKKCLAVVEVHIGNKTITTEVGLAVVPEEEALVEEAE